MLPTADGLAGQHLDGEAQQSCVSVDPCAPLATADAQASQVDPIQSAPTDQPSGAAAIVVARTTQAGFDFIDSYAQYADVLEAPRLFHEAVGTQLLATVLNRSGVAITLGALSIPFDLWLVLLSGSGLGRSTLLNLAQPVLSEADLQGIEYSALWGSPQAVYQQLAEHASGLYVWGELSERLKLLQDPRFIGIKPWLTDRYDNLRIPEPVTYRATGKSNRDTPPIVFSHSPRINILATSSEEWFFNNLIQEDSTGGFVPRWVIFQAADTKRVIPVPRNPDPGLIRPLAEYLRRASQLSGKGDFSQVLVPYAEWYEATKERFESQPHRAIASAYFSRHRGHVLKLAVIFEVSSSLSLRVSVRSWDRAVRMAAQLEKTIFGLLPTGMSGSGYLMRQISDKVNEAGESGLALSALTRAFQHHDTRNRQDLLNTLVGGETVFAFSRQTEGRPACILVHADFVDAYRARFPESIPWTRKR